MGKKRSSTPRQPKPAKPSATDDVIALYAHLLIGQQRRVKAEQRALAALAKQADQNGVRWPVVKECLKEYEQTAEARRAKMEQQAVVFAAIGVPVQFELFEAYEPKVNDSEGDAARKGRFAAICHGECKPPYPAGSKEGQAWMDGWHQVMRLVSSHETRMENTAPADTSADDSWDEKPVSSVQQLESTPGEGAPVNHDPDATDEPPKAA